MESHKDILQRQPVWIALSEFYLDTELDEHDLKRIAQVFKASGLDLQSIKDIDKQEVFPVLQYNLLWVAGIWDGFDPAFLTEACTKMYFKRNTWWHKSWISIWNRLFYWMRKGYWKEVELYYNQSVTSL